MSSFVVYHLVSLLDARATSFSTGNAGRDALLDASTPPMVRLGPTRLPLAPYIDLCDMDA